jgi:hypothetical protein
MLKPRFPSRETRLHRNKKKRGLSSSGILLLRNKLPIGVKIDLALEALSRQPFRHALTEMDPDVKKAFFKAKAEVVKRVLVKKGVDAKMARKILLLKQVKRNTKGWQFTGRHD